MSVAAVPAYAVGMTPTPVTTAIGRAGHGTPGASGHRPSGRPRRGLAAILTAGLLLAACGGADDTGKAGDVASAMPAPMPSAGMPSPEAGMARDRGMDGVSGGDVVLDDRAIVRNASIELVVDDGARAVEQVTALAASSGGHVASTFLSRDEDGTVSGSLTLRVPTGELDAVVVALDALARSVPYRSVDEFDVSLELSDLDARIANLRAFERELLELLTEARQREGTVEGLVTVSDRIREVRTEIDVIEGRRAQLADRVALSTVHVSVRQARSTTPVIGTWDLPGVVRDALAATLRLGQLAVEGAVWLMLTVLPAAVVLFIAFRVLRSVRRRRSAPSAALGVDAGSAPGPRG